MSALTDLTAAVQSVSASIDAAVVVLGNSSGDAAQLVALKDQLTAAQTKLDTAVTAASTPSA